jgi:hypothetical protein
MPREQAEGLAEGMQSDVGRRLDRVGTDVAGLKGDMKRLKWRVGVSIALTTGVLGRWLFQCAPIIGPHRLVGVRSFALFGMGAWLPGRGVSSL